MARSKYVAASGVTPHSNLTFRTANGVTNVTTPTTYSSQNLGSAAADNWVICAIMQDGGGSVTSVTIGGVSASHVVSETSSDPRTFIYAANVPAGGTGSIVINFSGGSQKMSCSHWTVNMTSGTATDTSTDTGSTDCRNAGRWRSRVLPLAACSIQRIRQHGDRRKGSGCCRLHHNKCGA